MNAPHKPAAPHRPLLTNAARPATFNVTSINEHGETGETPIAGEHALTLFVDKEELLTLMTLGAAPATAATCCLLQESGRSELRAMDIPRPFDDTFAQRATPAARRIQPHGIPGSPPSTHP